MSGVEAAAIGAAGGLLEAGISGLGQHSANRANVRLSREQMAFQERMSSTAYQRSVQDMRLAGLNPLYWLKGGATTPGGSLPHTENIAQGVRGTTGKALEARINAATVKNLEVQNAQILSQTAYNVASAREVNARTATINAALAGKELKGLPAKILRDILFGEVQAKVTSARSADRPGDKFFGPIRFRKKENK